MTQDGDDPFDIAAAHWARLQSGTATSAERAAIAARSADVAVPDCNRAQWAAAISKGSSPSWVMK